MKWFGKYKKAVKNLTIAGFIGLFSALSLMIPYSHNSEAAIAVFDERNIEEAVKTAIQTANILTEEQKQYLLQLTNMKKLDESVLEDLIKRNTEKQKSILAGDAVLPEGILNNGDKSVQAVWDERMGNIENVLNGNMTVTDMVMQEQKRQTAMHEAAKGTAEVAGQAVEFDKQNVEDATAALEASDDAEGQQQALQAGNHLTFALVNAVQNGNRIKAHEAATAAAYYDMKTQEKAESDRILKNSTNMSKEWVSNIK